MGVYREDYSPQEAYFLGAFYEDAMDEETALEAEGEGQDE